MVGLAADGGPIEPGPHHRVDPLTDTAVLTAAISVAPDTARALGGGAPCNFGYAVEVLTGAAEFARERAGPAP